MLSKLFQQAPSRLRQAPSRLRRSTRHFPRTALFLAVAAVTLVIALPLMVAACDSDDTSATEPDSGTDAVEVAMSELTRLPPAASENDVLSVAESVRAFSADLYHVLAAEAADRNLVFSPSSIVTALAMAYAGAAGPTAEEMAATLHFTLQGEALHQAFNSLDAALESRSWQQEDAEGREEGVLLKTANSLWGQEDTVFEQIFLDTLAANYGAGIRLVNYKTAAEQARQVINEWVAAETDNKITDLIPEGALNELTRLVLVNAIYLDATWLSQFNPELTTEGQFTTSSGDTVTTPMMRQTFRFPYAKGAGWQAVDLPYAGNQIAMTVIVPDQGRFAEVEGRLADGLSDEVFASLAEGPEVDLTLPKFEFRTQTGLGAALTALGMGSAFDPEKADFSNMAKDEALFISDVIHEAYIAVDEEGTEAAAATGVMLETVAMPLDMVQLVVDRPFLFALRDLETGALLFLGRVVNPTE